MEFNLRQTKVSGVLQFPGAFGSNTLYIDDSKMRPIESTTALRACVAHSCLACHIAKTMTEHRSHC